MVLKNSLTPTYQQQFLLLSVSGQMLLPSQMTSPLNNTLNAIFHNDFNKLRLWQYQVTVAWQRKEVALI
jgi:hypothetical protein